MGLGQLPCLFSLHHNLVPRWLENHRFFLVNVDVRPHLSCHKCLDFSSAPRFNVGCFSSQGWVISSQLIASEWGLNCHVEAEWPSSVSRLSWIPATHTYTRIYCRAMQMLLMEWASWCFSNSFPPVWHDFPVVTIMAITYFFKSKLWM